MSLLDLFVSLTFGLNALATYGIVDAMKRVLSAYGRLRANEAKMQRIKALFTCVSLAVGAGIGLALGHTGVPEQDLLIGLIAGTFSVTVHTTVKRLAPEWVAKIGSEKSESR